MIHDVDESLRALVKRDALNGSGVEITFDAPTKDWVARRNAPIVNLYLYDIREDLGRRDTAWVEVRDAAGRVTGRRLPPRRYRLSYLATAWTSRPEDEHRLLSSMLSAFVRHEYFPAELLQGSLEGEETPILVTVALPPADERKIADTWSALGGELKPSLDVVVTAPLTIERQAEAGPPVLEEPRLSLVRRQPDAVEAGAPPATVRRHADGGRSARPGRDDEPAAATAASGDAAEAGLPAETVIAGGQGAPGRRIHVRQIARP